MLKPLLHRYFFIPLLVFSPVVVHATVYEEHAQYLEYYSIDASGVMRFKFMRPLFVAVGWVTAIDSNTIFSVDHGLVAGDKVTFNTTANNLESKKDYWVLSDGLTANTFKVTATEESSTEVVLDDGAGLAISANFTSSAGTKGYSLGCKNSSGIVTGEIEMPANDKMANGFIMDVASGARFYVTAQARFDMDVAGVCTLQSVRLIRGI